ncbi:MAG: hypothetical protein M1829_003406 [Trizodia sp. TS-e1964]|nr:MAG: hypothetical protein M1829_003406 [Trizodia sp. TS-e1964]
MHSSSLLFACSLLALSSASSPTSYADAMFELCTGPFEVYDSGDPGAPTGCLGPDGDYKAYDPATGSIDHSQCADVSIGFLPGDTSLKLLVTNSDKEYSFCKLFSERSLHCNAKPDDLSLLDLVYYKPDSKRQDRNRQDGLGRLVNSAHDQYGFMLYKDKSGQQHLASTPTGTISLQCASKGRNYGEVTGTLYESFKRGFNNVRGSSLTRNRKGWE